MLLLTLLYNLIPKTLNNLQKNGSLNAIHQTHNSQPNWKTESTVKIAKKLIKKTEQDGSNL